MQIISIVENGTVRQLTADEIKILVNKKEKPTFDEKV